MDIVYAPLNTRLLKDAADIGCRTINGLSMFIHQAAFQFELWTKSPAPLAVMKQSLMDSSEQSPEKPFTKESLMIEIPTRPIRNTTVTVPGSKSYTHRALIVSALSDGDCQIHNGLDSEDTRLTRDALRQMGISIDQDLDSWRIRGAHGRLQPCSNPIFLGNSGTSMRLLAAVCALGNGKYILTGTPRMQERPIQDLLEGLHQIGVRTTCAWPSGMSARLKLKPA